jgi:hypothetical protein
MIEYRIMKIAKLTCLMFLYSTLLCSADAYGQGRRSCGCKTQKRWIAGAPQPSDETKEERKQKYNEYLKNCLAACNKARAYGKGKNNAVK